MSFNVCKVKNISGSPLPLIKTLTTGEEYVIPDSVRLEWATNDNVLAAITNDDLQVGDGSIYFDEYSLQIDWLKGYGIEARDTDNRDVVHQTARYLGTYTYFSSRDDDQSDPHAVGGGNGLASYKRATSTVAIANVARSSNVATIETSSAHGLSTGSKTDITCSTDGTYADISVTVTKIDNTHFTYANTGSDDSEKSATGTVCSDKLKSLYLDYNTINNITYIRQGDLQWKTCDHDKVSFNLVPKVTAYTSGTNTNYNLYGGYLIIPAAGDGTIQVAANDIVLVQNTPNEFGQMPAGYWDADWNTTTKQFDNITANGSGTGEFNMFGLEVVLFRFMYERLLLGTGRKDCMTDDSSRMGHGIRMRIDLETCNADHAWELAAALMLYRTKTT